MRESGLVCVAVPISAVAAVKGYAAVMQVAVGLVLLIDLGDCVFPAGLLNDHALGGAAVIRNPHDNAADLYAQACGFCLCCHCHACRAGDCHHFEYVLVHGFE